MLATSVKNLRSARRAGNFSLGPARFIGAGKLEVGHGRPKAIALAALISLSLLSGCLVVGPATGSRPPRQDYSAPSAYAARSVASADAERLRRVMLPLLRAMNRPCRLDQVRVGIINQNDINAANAGNCQFYVTAGLLRRASDDQLRGVLAHEIAHEDLGHVARAQVRGAGLNILAAGLQQLFPAAGALAPIAGELVARNYSRQEEFEADGHGVEILRRAGYSKQTMLNSLTWIRGAAGNTGGGFLSTHPALDDRISSIERLR